MVGELITQADTRKEYLINLHGFIIAEELRGIALDAINQQPATTHS